MDVGAFDAKSCRRVGGISVAVGKGEGCYCADVWLSSVWLMEQGN